MRLVTIIAAALTVASGAAAQQPGQTFRDCPECPEMVTIPAGTYLMGSPASEKDRAENEGPQHTVRISQFALGKYEVTVGEFAAFVRETGHRTEGGCLVYDTAKQDWDKRADADWRKPGFEQSDRHPVVCVDWHDAKAYAAWLSKKTGKAYRLPSESEWEYAARAGATTARSWGDDPDQACRHANVADATVKRTWNPSWPTHDCDDGFAFTAPVGRFAANRFGLHDMDGNVSELVEDCWNGEYTGAPSDGRSWLASDCSGRVLRGGSWYFNPGMIRSAHRRQIVFSTSNPNFNILGFRVAAPVASSAVAAPRPGETFRECADCPELTMIPAGTFLMGSSVAEQQKNHTSSEEGPQRMVQITHFALGKYEVTVGEFAAFARETGYRAEGGCQNRDPARRIPWEVSPGVDWRKPGFEQSDRHPVVCVDWKDAAAYVAWLSKKTGQAYRLPTEAEWEYAARAGTTTERYWGDDIGRNNANCDKCGSQWDNRQTAPVGSFPANRFGLHDMLGNVGEWVEDCATYNYSGAPTDGTGYSAYSCPPRYSRGGSWVSIPRFVRSGQRFTASSDVRSIVSGLRVARTVESAVPGFNSPERLAREERRRMEIQVHRILAETDRALEARDWPAAKRSLADAKRLNPDHPEVADAERRLAAAEAASARTGPARVFRDCPDCPEMVEIPAGTFLMGSPATEEGREDRENREGPQRTVRIASFALGKYEVTFAEWDACVSAGGCKKRPRDGDWGRGRRPVMDISWHDINGYVAWLSRKTGKGYRLPSEAEWEYAARAGTRTRFWWGDDVGLNNANCDGCGSQWDKKQTAPVGSFAANRFGLHDMHGNVTEQVQDCRNDNHSGAPADGAARTSGNCSSRIIRGGSWDDPPAELRSAHRVGRTTDDGYYQSFLIGFRVARTSE